MLKIERQTIKPLTLKYIAYGGITMSGSATYTSLSPIYLAAFCHMPYTSIILSSTGHVSQCCHQWEQLGQLNKTSNILDFWRSPIAQEVRQNTINNVLHPLCSSWSSCPYIVKDKVPYLFSAYSNYAFPTRLEICLPDTHCNIGGPNPTQENPACLMCRRNWEIPHQEDITEFLCDKALPLMPHVRELTIMGIAEPFWKDKIFKIYELLRFNDHKHHCTLVTNTNGTCLGENTIYKFFEETEYSDISFSIDAATKETYQKIRRRDSFHYVLQNISNYTRIRNEFGGSEKHTVRIWNNINLLNVNEMAMMVEIADSLGIKRMVMVPTHNQHGIVKLSNFMLSAENVHIFKMASENALKRAEELGIELVYPNRFDIVPPPKEPDYK